ncbi:hypothetical protein [Spirosoma foliorum]|uniref:Uncharacterized protein n=1 Tax=Spirosoma foliorum TaxID=2710596 RepID=A0A7G5GVS8_9BACT|nr:hypothetical protein [Spirosoma foliorum]QMW02970.1 hypothetical protein H3H32_34660 [Spirosoma foliorum]
MQGSKPDYQNLGLSTIMGTQLRLLVETQLLAELTNYGLETNNLKFDWSGSCIQGHDASYLDGQLENFSGIFLFDTNDQLIVDGWMEFIHEGNFFLAYWEFIAVWEEQKKVFEKAKPGIPDHIWQQIPDDLKWNYEKERL